MATNTTADSVLEVQRDNYLLVFHSFHRTYKIGCVENRGGPFFSCIYGERKRTAHTKKKSFSETRSKSLQLQLAHQKENRIMMTQVVAGGRPHEVNCVTRPGLN
jgi:hypothetical protein